MLSIQLCISSINFPLLFSEIFLLIRRFSINLLITLLLECLVVPVIIFLGLTTLLSFNSDPLNALFWGIILFIKGIDDCILLVGSIYPRLLTSISQVFPYDTLLSTEMTSPSVSSLTHTHIPSFSNYNSSLPSAAPSNHTSSNHSAAHSPPFNFPSTYSPLHASDTTSFVAFVGDSTHHQFPSTYFPLHPSDTTKSVRPSSSTHSSPSSGIPPPITFVHPMITIARNAIFKPNSLLFSSLAPIPEPDNVTQALAISQWK